MTTEPTSGLTVDRDATVAFIRGRLDRGLTPTPTELRTLLALIGEMQADLDAVTRPALADVTVYELRYGHPDDRPDTVALYATPYAAMDHGSAAFEARHGDAYTVTWHETPTGYESHVTDMDGASVVGDWHIVAVTAPAAYTPAGGESR